MTQAELDAIYQKLKDEARICVSNDGVPLYYMTLEEWMLLAEGLEQVEEELNKPKK